MELIKIEKLLNKYFDAETNLEEERVLKNYFSSDDIAPHLTEYTSLFNGFKINLDDTFSVEIEGVTSPKRKTNYISIAASVVLLIGISYFSKQEYDKYILKQNLAKVRSVLKTVSKNLNKGEQAIAKLNMLTQSSVKATEVEK